MHKLPLPSSLYVFIIIKSFRLKFDTVHKTAYNFTQDYFFEIMYFRKIGDNVVRQFIIF